jgi:uroporphyrinogen decarboxylase
MVAFSMRIAQDFDGLKRDAERLVTEKLIECKKLMDAGMDGFTLCSDYAFNHGPFLSPDMFSELIAPNLKRLVEGLRKMGACVIKHSDGDLMPIIDMIVDSQPHAIHSIDPMAGMDIKKIHETYGKQVAICGNVRCDYLQTGTPEQIRESCEYCLKWVKPGGGYLYSTSNTVYRGLPIENYDLMHSIWMENRDYTKD